MCFRMSKAIYMYTYVCMCVCLYVYVCNDKTVGGAGVVAVDRTSSSASTAAHHCNLKIHSCRRVTSERRQPSRGSSTKRNALRTKCCDCMQNSDTLLVSFLFLFFFCFIY